MTDRGSVTEAGRCSVVVDRDHRGGFRGQQAMSKDYRGCHYHVESETFSQDEIMAFLETKLAELGAKRVEIPIADLGIGIVENTPSKYSVWELEGKTTVLWISAVTHNLHIETNKNVEYSKGILVKKNLMNFLKKM